MLSALTLLLALTFTSADGSSIAGTLTYPQSTAGKVPAVVLVGSNGPSDRTELVGITPVFDLYADALNKAGFAVLRYDNRGVGQSTTKTQAERVRRQNFIDDAVAAVRALASDPAIDPSRISILGLSEGGETAVAAALAGAPVRSLVLVGALSVPYAQAMAEQDAAASELVKQRDALLLAMPYFQSYAGVDPRKEIAFVRQPLLLVRGLSDTQTPPADFDGLVQAGQNARRDITVERFPGDDHFLLQLSQEELHGTPQYQQRHELDPAAAGAIVTWLLSH